MSGLAISLLGRFSVAANGASLPGFDVAKVQELFVYLLLHRSTPHHRDRLADLLWQDASEGQAKRYLSKTLWQLQCALNGFPVQPAVLHVDIDWIQIDSTCDLWLDVEVIERQFEQMRNLPGQSLTPDQAAEVQAATALYQSDLLQGWYQDWCIIHRERLQLIYLSLVDKLMDFCEQHRLYEQGIGYGRDILRFDQARESTHRRLMRLHYLTGDRTGALRQYQRCVTALRAELQVMPGKRTQALLREIEADTLGGAPAAAPTADSLAEGLHLLYRRLREIQAQIANELHAVETLLQR